MADTNKVPGSAGGKRVDQPTGTETVGHEWDGIEELNTPLPRWWLWSFYATILWGVAFMVFYPAWPLKDRATEGLLGWTSTGELEQEMAEQQQRMAPIRAAIAGADIATLQNNPALFSQAVEGGRAAFRMHCVQCHGSGAAGSPGYPNLNDDDWLWGGRLEDIHFTITHGIRQPEHAPTRISQMPAFGQALPADQIADLTSFVRAVSGQQGADEAARRGQALFRDNCAACHGARAEGNRDLGAPNLADGIWLYGGDAQSIQNTIANSRYGVMPRWDNRLDPVTIKMLAAYVHSLGGGESRMGQVETASR